MKCAVVGGGAAGLMAACALAEGGAQVALLERQSRVGKKLLATGNGRCNLTNLSVSPDHYRGSEAHIRAVLSRWGAQDVLAEFRRMGVDAVSDDQGRVYPASNQASSVLDDLRLTLRERGGREVTDFDAIRIVQGRGFAVQASDGRTEECEKLLIACGGMASPRLGGGDGGYRLLEALGHPVTPRLPGIAPLNTDTAPLKGLKGIRVRGAVCLTDGIRPVRRETGEVLFTDYGLSGICVMQLSGSVHGLCDPWVELDFAPGYEERALFERVRSLEKRSLEDLLNGLLPRRLGWNVLEEAGLTRKDILSGELSSRQIHALWRALRAFRVRVKGVCGFDSAQITRGGADMKWFDPDTLMSRRINGLYVAGEVCDVDGDCGGFNLHWAWASALTAADAMLGSR